MNGILFQSLGINYYSQTDVSASQVAEIHSYIDRFIQKFYETCENIGGDKHYLIQRVDNRYSLALFYDKEKQNSPYILYYDRKAENEIKRIYSVDINSLTNIKEIYTVMMENNLMVKSVNFYQVTIDKGIPQNLWVYDDMQRYAEMVDKYNIDYEL